LLLRDGTGDAAIVEIVRLSAAVGKGMRGVMTKRAPLAQTRCSFSAGVTGIFLLSILSMQIPECDDSDVDSEGEGKIDIVHQS
jgi:hypothetical protein